MPRCTIGTFVMPSTKRHLKDVQDEEQFISLRPQGYTWPSTIIIYDYLFNKAYTQDMDSRPTLWHPLKNIEKLGVEVSLLLEESKFQRGYDKQSIGVMLTIPNKELKKMLKVVPAESKLIIDPFTVSADKKSTKILTGYIPGKYGRYIRQGIKLKMLDPERIWICGFDTRAPVKKLTKTGILPWKSPFTNFVNINLVVLYANTYYNEKKQAFVSVGYNKSTLDIDLEELII